ncbi:MAG TPA: succinate dehydrogenase assembly factor 2 [Gammaproteobacteria bacterium]|nr:succinate dehydrogenase assembly factor 2 [Gammaproteobacteria bacterium]
MKIPAEQHINRVTWRARRGARELDGLLLPYARHLVSQQNSGDVSLFEELLEHPDPVLMDWFMGKSIPANPYLSALIRDILRFSRTSNSS